MSGVLVCWSLDLGLTLDGSLSFSFPLDRLGQGIADIKINTSLLGQLRIFNKVTVVVCPSHISPLERLFVLKILLRTQRATEVKIFVGFSLKQLNVVEIQYSLH